MFYYPHMSERKYAKALGKTIKTLRGARTQKQIADAANIPISTLSKIEQARQIPRNDTFSRIAGGLGLSVAELEKEVVETTLGALEQEKRMATGDSEPASSQPDSGLGDDVDLSQIPRAAALRLKSTSSTIESLRHHLDNLEHDVRSLAGEFQLLTSPRN